MANFLLHNLSFPLGFELSDFNVSDNNPNVSIMIDALLPPVPDYHPPPVLFPTPQHSPLLQEIINSLRFYYTPVLVVVGVLGNIFCSVVLMRTQLKTFSFVHYLAAILLADTFFLFNLMCLWMVDMGINLYHLGAWCHFTTFLSHTSCFLSLWYTVALSIDRSIVMHCSSQARKLCTVLRAKVVVVTLAMTAIAVYLNISLTVGVVHLGTTAICTPLSIFIKALRTLNHIDIFLNSMVPYIILLLVVIPGLVRAYIERNWVTGMRGPRGPGQPIDTDVEKGHNVLMLSFVIYFIVLTLPSQAFRFVITIREMMSSPLDMMSIRAMSWQQLLQYLYYTRYSLNIVVIFASFEGFRGACAHLYHMCIHCSAMDACGRQREVVCQSDIEENDTTNDTTLALDSITANSNRTLV